MHPVDVPIFLCNSIKFVQTWPLNYYEEEAEASLLQLLMLLDDIYILFLQAVTKIRIEIKWDVVDIQM